jgi:hypothetical protein
MSNRAPYTPVPGSLAERVCRFFAVNADESLSAKDIVLKFDATTASNVQAQLETAVGYGFLARSSVGYSAGGRLGDLNLHILGTRQIGLTKTPRKVARKSLEPIDFTAVAILHDMPKPDADRGSRTRKYADLIDRMAPGTSVVLPEAHARRFYDWAKKFGSKTNPAQRWSFRRLVDGTAGVWRDE